MTKSVNLLGFMALALAAACSSSGGGGQGVGAGPGWTGNQEPPPPWATTMSRVDTCTMSTCEHSYRACEAQESSCWSECSLMLDYAVECSAACSNMSCEPCTSEDNDVCALYIYEFEINSDPDPTLLTACKAAVTRDQTCGEKHVMSDCEHFARLEDPKYASVYECIAATPCGQEIDSCLSGIEANPTAELFAKEFNSTCANQYVMGPEQIAQLTAAVSWMKPHVRDALLSCTDNSYCDNVYTCEEAWFDVVFPQL